MPADSKEQVHEYSIVDVQAVDLRNPQASVRKGTFSRPDRIVECDILIVGGGMGGIAAALQASDSAHGKQALKVCLTEETNWLGGQMTAQGVSAFDENKFVETTGACRNYLALRTAIRDYYKQNHKLTDAARAKKYLDPGTCWVSRLAFEPRVAIKLIDDLLEHSVQAGNLTISRRFKPIYVVPASGAEKSGTAPVTAVGMLDLRSYEIHEFQAKIVLDATELGDILALAAVPFRLGSDAKELTQESHAPAKGDADNVQDFTYPFVLEFRPGENHTIEKPPHYDDFNKRGKFSFEGYKMFVSSTKETDDGRIVDVLPFWTYRRLIDKDLFDRSEFPFDLSMINWNSNDLRGENIVGVPAEKQAERLALAKSLSLGFLFWLQTEAPRDDGGNGYPELKLLTDVLGSEDGLSLYPYIRECRRVVARSMIVEEDIVAATNSSARARHCNDSVGIGLYPVDIHGMQEVRGAAQETKPFQIPLSALVPEQETNILPACKNIGTTHITNGAYRLHPIEWSIGEAQGLLARFCLEHKMTPAHVLSDDASLHCLQRILVEAGIPIFWFDDLPLDHRHFAAMQYLAQTGILEHADDDLHCHPDEPIAAREAQAILQRLHVAGIVPRESINIENAEDITRGRLAQIIYDSSALGTLV